MTNTKTSKTNVSKTVKAMLSVSAALLVAVAVGSSAMAEGYGKHKGRYGGHDGGAHGGGRGGIASIFMHNADANGDKAVTFEEVSVRIDAIFTDMDKDKDASLTKEELQTGLKAKMEERQKQRVENAKGKDGNERKGRKFAGKHGGKHNGKRSGNKLDRLIERIDVNGDGVIAKTEVQDRMQKTFAFLDVNNDGKLEGKELRKGKHNGMRGGKHGGKHSGRDGGNGHKRTY
ncbi:MAG: hypothetical protein COC00_003875 [Rhizobiales bacterium]|nr:hypothetical protein [Hyphomicrobiales bacterium]